LRHLFLLTTQVTLLITACILVAAFFKHKGVSFTISLLSGIVILIELMSIYIGGALFDYKCYIHANIANMLGFVNMYWLQSFAFIVGLGVLSWSIFRLSNALIQKRRLSKPLCFLGLSTCLLLMNVEEGILSNLYHIYQLNKIPIYSFDDSLENLGICPKEYVQSSSVQAIKGKNIIVLSLESLEKGYLSKNLERLTPNLRQLAQEMTFYEMQQCEGAGWTSASMYCTQTGIPAFFRGNSNAVFQMTNNIKLTGIAHILKKAGYDMSYMIGKPAFAGMEDLLTAYGFSVKSEKTFDTTYKVFPIGMHDKDLFAELKKEISQKASSTTPFAIFASTVSSHAPNGIYDERMLKYIGKEADNLAFMVKATDYWVGDLIHFLKEKGLLSNTIIFIFPDHLLMGQTAAVLKDFPERGLYIITNAHQEQISFNPNDTLLQIDLPKLILRGAEIKHNAKFLTDYLGSLTKEQKIQFIKENYGKLLSLNEASIGRTKTYQTLKRIGKEGKDVTRFIAHAGGKIDGQAYTNCLEALSLSYSKGYRLFELDIIKTTDNAFVAAHDWEHWSNLTGYQGKLPVTLQEFKKYKIKGKYTPLDMSIINDWFRCHEDAILVTDKINEPTNFANQFIDRKRLMMELFTIEAVREGLKAGIKSAIPSESVINSIHWNKVGVLKSLGITDIAVSRRMVENNPSFLKQVKDIGIKTYVYHVNFDLGKDEQYVLKHDMDFIYGMYADDWSFEFKNAICPQ
jgi:lipoteichoic acid synthase